MVESAVVGGKYKLVSKIGEGGTSEVFLAIDVNNESKKFAVKLLKNKSISHRIDDLIRFRNEAILVSKLDHPNIVKIYEIGEEGSQYYIVMEYIKGVSLHRMIKDGRKFSIDESLEIVIQICQALDYIHNASIIHKDLKPSNIMVSEENGKVSIKIIDFGLAQIKEISEIGDKDEIVGTFGYMSPEQCGMMRATVDERSDLYL